MRLDFLTPRVERLRADGAFEVLHDGGSLGRLRRPVVLLARELCAFALFPTAALPRNRRRQAARLHARAASPYVGGGAALVKAGDDFGVWWWDLERVADGLDRRFGPHPPALRPETLAQPAGAGWRVVRLNPGYEAQRWRDGALVATAWRRDRFDAAAWAAFARLQRSEDAPDAPPPAESLPVAFDSEAFALSRSEITREQAAGLAAGALATAAVLATVFLWGQTLKLGSDADRIAAEAAEIRAATPQAGSVRAMELDRQRLVAFRQAEAHTNPISAAGAAIGVLALHDLTPTRVDAEVDRLSLTLPYEAVAKADQLIPEFEQSGYFYAVRPRTDGTARSLVIEMRVREASPPLGSETAPGG